MKRLGVLLVLMFCVALASAQTPVNMLNIGGNLASTGNGGSGTGVLRVTIANDSTGQIALVAGSAVVGKFDILGNSGAAMDVLQGGATAAVNALQIAGVFNTALPTLTNGQGGAIQLDTKGQALVDLNYVNGAAINTGNGTASASIRVAIASDNTAFSVNAAQSGNWTSRIVGNAGAIMDFIGQNATQPANALLIGGEFNTTPTTIVDGKASPLQLDSLGKLLVNCTGCSAGSTVSLIPATTGGLTLSHTVLAASTNATSLKGSAGQVYEACLNNNVNYPLFLKFYNKATAPTVGTDTPVKVLEAQAGVPGCMRTEEGFTFATGIAWAVTKGITDADTTAPSLSDGTVEIASK